MQIGAQASVKVHGTEISHTAVGKAMKKNTQIFHFFKPVRILSWFQENEDRVLLPILCDWTN